jgi:thymidine kinase
MAYLKVITGPMFSGKTEELIRILHRSGLAGKKIVVVKPKIDSRTAEEIASRRLAADADDKSRAFSKYGSFPASSIETAQEFETIIHEEKPAVIGIDEAQFFQPWLFDYLAELLRRYNDSDLQVLVAGLDMDAWGRPFGMMPHIMALADEVQKETAICFRCKQPAMYTQKLSDSSKQVEVGDAEIYEARCRVCHIIPGQ